MKGDFSNLWINVTGIFSLLSVVAIVLYSLIVYAIGAYMLKDKKVVFPQILKINVLGFIIGFIATLIIKLIIMPRRGSYPTDVLYQVDYGIWFKLLLPQVFIIGLICTAVAGIYYLAKIQKADK